jgi:hypothetical protein
MRGLGSISFWMPSSDVLELNDVLFVHGSMKNLLLVSCLEKLQYRVAFEGQCCTISNCSLASLGTLARGVEEGGIFKLLVDPMTLLH